MMKVSILIPTYNQGLYISECLESALSQGPRVEEIIVSDDASTDNTAEICRRFAKRDSKVRYVRQDRNIGVGANRRELARNSKCELCVMLDSDDRLERSYVNDIASLFEKYDDLGYASTRIKEIDSEGLILGERFMARRRKQMYETASEALISLLRGYQVAANIIMYRREALVSALKNDLNLDYAEDFALAVLIARAGFGNVYVDLPLASYRLWWNRREVRLEMLIKQLCGLSIVYRSILGSALVKEGYKGSTVEKAFKKQLLGLVEASRWLKGEEREYYNRMVFAVSRESCQVGMKIALIESRYSGRFIMWLLEKRTSSIKWIKRQLSRT